MPLSSRERESKAQMLADPNNPYVIPSNVDPFDEALIRGRALVIQRQNARVNRVPAGTTVLTGSTQATQGTSTQGGKNKKSKKGKKSKQSKKSKTRR